MRPLIEIRPTDHARRFLHLDVICDPTSERGDAARHGRWQEYMKPGFMALTGQQLTSPFVPKPVHRCPVAASTAMKSKHR